MPASRSSVTRSSSSTTRTPPSPTSGSGIMRRRPRQAWKPHDYQKTAVKWLVQHPEAGLFLDPGLGKTSVATKAFQALQRAKAVRKTLVVAPLRPCYMVWSQEGDGELAKWEDFKDLRVSLIHGKDVREREAAVEADADMYVINFDGLRWLIDSGNLMKLLRSGVDHLIVDELSKFKHPRGITFKMFKRFLGRFKRRWGLTGSPASNGLMDLFGQVYVLDLGKRLGRFITKYRDEYFIPTGFGGYTWVPQPDAEERIYEQLKDLALSMRATDHLDLPPLIEQDLFVHLDKKSAKVYEQLEDALFTVVDGHEVFAANAAVASGKCRQVASGGLYLDPAADHSTSDTASRVKRAWTHLHDLKTDALQELVDELQGSPLLVAYEFNHDLERIRKALGDVPAINGGIAAKDARVLIDRWNDGELPILCGHPAAMGHGLNLQAAGGHICWYTLTWDLELYDQLNRRIWRQGTKAPRVVIHRLLARDTIDEAVATALASKKRGQDALFDGLKALRLRRR